MDNIVMDASAILALLNQEMGHEMVEKYLPKSMLSTVNFTEVMTVLSDAGLPVKESEQMIMEIIKEVVPFDAHQATIAAELRKETKKTGLSLGDRACLALAKRRHLSVLTADKSWNKLDVGIEVQLIR